MLVDINLLPKKERKSKKTLVIYLLLCLLTLALLGGFIFWSYSISEKIDRLESDLHQQEIANAELQSEIDGDEEYQTAQQLSNITSELDQLMMSTNEIVNDLDMIVPSNAELTSFNYSENSIELIVETMTNEDAVTFYQDLQMIDHFNEVRIHTINYIESDDDYTTRYTISLQEEEVENNE
ncbi:Tfp pilus assembly protein PilN [Alkalibacillus filiformis]|uniref:Tfp pilus assembly protein PilN n=1 Tax=Alkalibacillus filiformis TaxID=200990 RepID=A0ABU0DUI0_9BACI|nr:PilN domain-containing protein [Alkalibacillus filiformis]MDQ0351999.1 Tfp pilus assembly protein PilN [Alkalibacillus filiformis]